MGSSICPHDGGQMSCTPEPSLQAHESMKFKELHLSQVWWCTPIISTPKTEAWVQGQPGRRSKASKNRRKGQREGRSEGEDEKRKGK